MAKCTFKIDKQSGHIWQLVKSPSDDVGWKPMTVVNLHSPSTPGVHFQLFLSGLANQYIFLLNVDSGQTWQLQGGRDHISNEETLSWIPIPDSPR
jgi:hypothetical protein